MKMFYVAFHQTGGVHTPTTAIDQVVYKHNQIKALLNKDEVVDVEFRIESKKTNLGDDKDAKSQNRHLFILEKIENQINEFVLQK